MATEKLTVQSTITAKKQTVWDCYTLPEHIKQWNFADPSWHCPSASNELTVGGKYFARMEAKDGSFGFDFEAVYTEIHPGNSFTYVFGERYATVSFQEIQEQTEVTIVFDPETENPLELQKQGWQAILNHFKKYVETTEND